MAKKVKRLSTLFIATFSAAAVVCGGDRQPGKPKATADTDKRWKLLIKRRSLGSRTSPGAGQADPSFSALGPKQHLILDHMKTLSQRLSRSGWRLLDFPYSVTAEYSFGLSGSLEWSGSMYAVRICSIWLRPLHSRPGPTLIPSEPCPNPLTSPSGV